MSSSTGIADSGNSTISFDGDNVLCQVCGDKSSGFHYGVHACEGCKGFFRRSIQQKLQYRPCTNKDEQQRCSILRVNRNRCQYCRLKKCIAVGMSRDAVRFGRVPKREKVKLLAEMQKANSHCQMTALTVEMDDGRRTVEAIVSAHFETCDFTKAKADKFLGRDERRNSSRVACPLNPRVPDEGNAEELTERYSPAIRGVVNFAKSIPGFHVLCQEDQITLLKAGVFEVLLLRLVRLFDFGKEQVVLLDGSVYKRESRRTGCHGNGIQGQGCFLVDSLFDFAERFNSFDLTDAEIALFCAYVLISPDRTGLRNPEVIEIMNLRLKQLLLAVLQNQNAHHCHGNQSNGERCYSGKQLLDTLISKVQDLRTLSTLHSEKLLAFKTESHQHNNDTLSNPNPPQSLCNSDLSKRVKMSHPDINIVPRLTIGANSDSGKGASPAACSDSSDSSDASSGSVGSGNRKRRITDCMPNLKRALLTPACDTFVARDIRARHAALTALLERPAEHRATPYGDAYASVDATTVAFRQWWLNGSSLILPQGFYYGATPALAFTPEIAVAASSCPSKSVVYDEDQPLNLSKKILPVKC